jgi:hypothetical protein
MNICVCVCVCECFEIDRMFEREFVSEESTISSNVHEEAKWRNEMLRVCVVGTHIYTHAHTHTFAGALTQRGRRKRAAPSLAVAGHTQS